LHSQSKHVGKISKIGPEGFAFHHPEGLITSPSRGRYVPFSLPQGDRTPILLSKSANTPQEDGDEDTGTKLPETLYKVTKVVMKNNQGASFQIAGMGTLTPKTSAGGQHGYEVEFPHGHEKHVHYAFELKAANGAEKKTTSGNFFAPLANPKGLTGAIGHCWKCNFKQVHAKMNPTKPFVITTKALHLVKGEPMLIGGPAKPEGAA